MQTVFSQNRQLLIKSMSNYIFLTKSSFLKLVSVPWASAHLESPQGSFSVCLPVIFLQKRSESLTPEGSMAARSRGLRPTWFPGPGDLASPPSFPLPWGQPVPALRTWLQHFYFPRMQRLASQGALGTGVSRPWGEKCPPRRAQARPCPPMSPRLPC